MKVKDLFKYIQDHPETYDYDIVIYDDEYDQFYEMDEINIIKEAEEYQLKTLKGSKLPFFYLGVWDD